MAQGGQLFTDSLTGVKEIWILGATDISEDWNPASQDCCATISVLLIFFELILLCLCLIFSSLPILWAVSKVVLVLVLETK